MTFFVAVTATFPLLYVFVVVERGTGGWRIKFTANPTADWADNQKGSASI